MRRTRLREIAQRWVALSLTLVTLSAAPTAAVRPCPMLGSGHGSEPMSHEAGAPTTAGHHATAPVGSEATETDHGGDGHSGPCDCLATCLTCCAPALGTNTDHKLGIPAVDPVRLTPHRWQVPVRPNARLSPLARPPPA